MYKSPHPTLPRCYFHLRWIFFISNSRRHSSPISWQLLSPNWSCSTAASSRNRIPVVFPRGGKSNISGKWSATASKFWFSSYLISSCSKVFILSYLILLSGFHLILLIGFHLIFSYLAHWHQLPVYKSLLSPEWGWFVLRCSRNRFHKNRKILSWECGKHEHEGESLKVKFL